MMKILYAEDNEDNIFMLKRRLEKHGHSVLVAENGANAIEMARDHQPDVVLMDLELPVLDGWTAIRRIREDETLAEIPVIALSAHALAEFRERAMEAGATEFRTKPVDFGALLQALQQFEG